MKKSTVILSNSLKSLSYLFEFLPFLCNPLTNTTSSSNHIPLWKESVSPLFSNIKSSTQTSNFLLCHIPEDLAWSLISPSPWILPFPYCFLLLWRCGRPTAVTTSCHQLQEQLVEHISAENLSKVRKSRTGSCKQSYHQPGWAIFGTILTDSPLLYSLPAFLFQPSCLSLPQPETPRSDWSIIW